MIKNDTQRQKSILIVEDEKALRGAVVDILRRKNFLPLQAKNGKEGVEIALSEHPDMILLDIIMPEMDGMTALKKIRQDRWGASVPVIILTNVSAASDKLVKDAIMCTPINYLIKSDWKLHDVVEKVEEVFSENK